MGSNADATLAYGYDLGSAEEFKAEQVGEYGSPKLPWFDPEGDDEDDSEPTHDFPEAAEKVLLESVGFTEEWTEAGTGYYQRKSVAEKLIGVTFDTAGSSDYPGWVLIAKGSSSSVSWAETMALDLNELRDRPASEGGTRNLPPR